MYRLIGLRCERVRREGVWEKEEWVQGRVGGRLQAGRVGSLRVRQERMAWEGGLAIVTVSGCLRVPEKERSLRWEWARIECWGRWRGEGEQRT